MRQSQRSVSLLIGTLLVLGMGYEARSAVAQTAPPLILEKNHTLNYGTFLGGVGDDKARGVGVLSDGSIVVAGNFSNLQTRGTKQLIAPGARSTDKARLLRISADGRQVLAELTLGERIDDMELKSVSGQPYSERLVIGGTFGVAVVRPWDFGIVWSKQLPEAAGNGASEGQQTRVAISNANQVVALRAKKIRLFDSNGVEKATTLTIDRDFVTDVAIDPLDSKVYAVGFANRFNANNLNPATGKPYPVQVAFLYALNTKDLSTAWRTWDYNPNLLTPSSESGSAPQNNMADTRLYQVIVGKDGKVAVLGEAAGGNNIFRWNGKDFTTTSIVKYDAYSDTYNSRSSHFVYYAKVEPSTGVVIAGQHAVPRLPGTTPGAVGLSNSFKINDGALAVDAQGNMYIGGISAFGIPERDANTFSGTPVGTYGGDDMTLLTISADFRKRIRWTPLSRDVAGVGGGGTLSGIALTNNGRLVLWGTATFGNLMTTPNAIAPSPFDPAKDDGKKDAYLGILKITP